jgi:hypothetical protein
MSTKTSFKRVALVAVAALAIGGLSAIPAFAAITGVSETAVVTTTPDSSTATGTTPGAAGTAITADLKESLAGGSVAAASAWTSTFTVLDPNGTDVTSGATFASAFTTLTGSNSAGVFTVNAAAAVSTGTYKIGTLSFTPKMAGQYLIKAFHSAVTGDTIAATTVATITTLFVSGAGATVSTTGLGTSTVGAVSGGIAKVNFMMAAHVLNDQYNLTTSGVGSINTAVVGLGNVAATAPSGIAGATDFSQGAKLIAAGATFEGALATVSSSVAGTQTLTWSSISSSTGAPTTVATATITWSGSSSTSISAANSSAFITTGASGSGVTADSTTALSYDKAVNTSAAQANISNLWFWID